LLTIPLVMIAEVAIYVPSIANSRVNRLNDRLAAANTAALVLDAAPSGMVPESLAGKSSQASARARVAIKMGRSAACWPAPTCRPRSIHDIDMRSMRCGRRFVDAFE